MGHIRGLDGIRALSVLAIIAFHTGLNSVPGGFYGVDSFFVLSGFLITSLLVREWSASGTIRLRRFWAGRARRLLPALFLLVAVIGIVLAVVPSLLATPNIVGDALSTMFYFSNWYSIHNGVTYFSLSTQPSPLLHTWSLAIEEQFYLVWPLVVLGVLKLGTTRRAARRAARRNAGRTDNDRTADRRAVDVLGGGQLLLVGPPPVHDDPAWIRRRRLQILFAVACLGSLASALLMAYLAPNGYTTRAYYGTDTRAQALLVGAAIAIGLTLWRDGSARRWFTRFASVLALAGVAGTAALWATTSETSTFAFSGGFLVASLAAGAVVLGCATAPRSLVVRLLELPPLPQWGRISYGVYLWYWPVLLVMTGQRLHWGVYPLFLARVGVTVAIAALSYDLVEMPIRRGALKRWRSWVAAPIGAAAAISAIFISTLVPVGAAELQGSQLAVSRAVLHDDDDVHGSGDPGRAGGRRGGADDDHDDDHLGALLPVGRAAGRDDREARQGPVGRRLRRRHARCRLGPGGPAVPRADRQRGDAGLLAVDADADQGALLHGGPRRALRRRQQPELAAPDVAQVGGCLQPRRRRLRGAGRDLRPGGGRPVAEHR